MTSSKCFFTDKQIKTSTRYLLQDQGEKEDFDNIKEVDHTEEIEQDIMPSHHNSKAQVNETEQSEFRKLPQIDSFESDALKDGLSRALKSKDNKEDNKNQHEQMLLKSSMQGDLMHAGILDSKAFFSRQKHTSINLLSSVEFHSGIKEI